MYNPQKFDVYAMVTGKIIESLEKGVVPWQKSWTSAGWPSNFITNRTYSGINVLLLSSLGYERNLFLTFKQLKQIGGSVNKGEKAHLVVFYKMLDREVEKDGGKELKAVPHLQYYKVFNVAQCRDIPLGMIPEDIGRNNTPVEACDDIVKNYYTRPKIVTKGDQPAYVPKDDIVKMPGMKKFSSPELYYQTLFHELLHSTGHQSRLNRKSFEETKGLTKRAIYGMEELVAEIGASYLSSVAGIMPKVIEDSASYINDWLKVFEGDRKFVVFAASYAQKAVDYMLNSLPEEAEETQNQEVMELQVAG